MEAYRKARWKVRSVIILYGAIGLAPLIVTIILGMIIMGPTAKIPSYDLYIMFPVFIWGLFWVQMMLSYVRTHPLPPGQGISDSDGQNSN